MEKKRIVIIRNREGHKNRTVFSPPFNKSKGVYITGLTKEDKEDLKERGLLNINLEERPDLPGIEHSFWSHPDCTVDFSPTGLSLNLENPLDELKLKYLLENKFVAPSFDDLSKYEYSNTRCYIFSNEQDVAKESSKVDLKNEIIHTLYSYSIESKKNLLTILSKEDVRNKSDEYIKVNIEKFINSDPKKVKAYLDKGTTYLNILAMIYRAMKKDIIKIENGEYTFLAKFIGRTEEACVSFFENKNNQEAFIKLEESLGEKFDREQAIKDNLEDITREKITKFINQDILEELIKKVLEEKKERKEKKTKEKKTKKSQK